MATAFDMMQPQTWTRERVFDIAEYSGYGTDDWIDARFVESNSKNIVFEITYADPDMDEPQKGKVFVRVDPYNDLILDF